MKIGSICLVLLLLESLGWTALKTHSVGLGKWNTVKWLTGDRDNGKPEDLKIRPLIVDGRNKEWTIGSAHEVTERTFVVQRMYRLNDSLPQESGAPRWLWERGAWLLVDRVSGKAQAINLAAFDAYNSSVSWFRDYAAYCGISDDGRKAFAIVMQLGRRKPLLKKELAEQSGENRGICPAPLWERNPARVTFSPGGKSFAYIVGSHAVDMTPSAEEEDDP